MLRLLELLPLPLPAVAVGGCCGAGREKGECEGGSFSSSPLVHHNPLRQLSTTHFPPSSSPSHLHSTPLPPSLSHHPHLISTTLLLSLIIPISFPLPPSLSSSSTSSPQPSFSLSSSSISSPLPPSLSHHPPPHLHHRHRQHCTTPVPPWTPWSVLPDLSHARPHHP
ncbi:hypothetical protein Pmani_034786 [Petrolisthes manimaculis]|uniref:Uncharacterized protein n=1 Tax=Petrolisthes manimaculis TaxID=1843537 RepID=A0AAE1TPB8_9EUCA|nr:hypothetical protein Pmani_034786 [Petrolisthes manimaculis]